MIILDTNVLSELMKAEPAASVSEWVAFQPPSRLFVTAITQAEILYGIGLLPTGRRRKGLCVGHNVAWRPAFDANAVNGDFDFDTVDEGEWIKSVEVGLTPSLAQRSSKRVQLA